ncbi:hypothetical protein [Candidatus Palauibacter sp.]|uniref:hypothetical protein n=1 Tax=Candidatus Palauibacter sp. TaxID=3101350 RepID=UPI003C6FB062
MSDRATVDLFVEDRAHEEFIVPLVKRIAAEEATAVRCRVRSAIGGHPRALREFESYQRLWERGVFTGIPDVLVVAIDTNCSTFARTRTEIEEATRDELRALLVTACPNPHIERWFMADLRSFHRMVGHRPALGATKCERGYYKHHLKDAVRRWRAPADARRYRIRLRSRRGDEPVPSRTSRPFAEGIRG